MVLPLALTGVARAQQPPEVNKPTAADTAAQKTSLSIRPGTHAILDVGYRGRSIDGDEARFERYRDLRPGVVAGVSAKSETDESLFRLNAANIGYRDQQYIADYNKYGKLKASAQWNSIPLNYAFYTMTPWKDQGNNVWTLDPAARTAVQNKVPGALGVGTTAADLANASIFRGLATPFPMQSRRDILSLGAKYRLTDAIGLNLGFISTKKTGTQPFGGSFSFSNANEHPMTLDNRTNDMSAAIEWAKPSAGVLRFEWVGSRFKNQFQSLTWDNPVRVTDFSNGKLPPLGPYDPSGYSNFNGAAVGRLSLPPSNTLNTFSVLGLHKMPGHTSLNGQIAFTSMKQNEALIPWTTNTVIASPVVYAAFPGLASLPRPTAEAEVQGVNAVLNFATRPTSYFGFDMRYRYNDHRNLTPVFNAEEYVRFDAVPEETGGETEHFNIRQNQFETGATFTMLRRSSIKLGYIVDDVKREGRAFAGMTDYTFRLSLDTFGSDFMMLRFLFENTNRVGNGFSEEALEEGGFQPGLRSYDEANMNRNKGHLIFQVTPSEKMDFGLLVSAGKDVYRGPGHEFGLLRSSNASYNLTFNTYPTDHITAGANYGYEKFNTHQKSRNANPLSGVPGAYESWLDPNRDWLLDNDEKVNNAGLYVDVTSLLPRTDLGLNYDLSRSDNPFVFSGPRIQELTTNIALTPRDGSPCGTSVAFCFAPLAPVKNTWQQLKVDIKHMLLANYGIGFGYMYEKLDIADFATRNLADGSPRVDPLGAITTGYGNRPYKGQTFTLRGMYTF
jgi:MtrB/PioB family decaheme-associated outer membrane protein